jgi:hypothetical protein
MDKQELDKLLLDIEELKRSVRKANPFLREIMAIKAYAILSFPLGILLLANCLLTHFLIGASGSFESIPSGWKTVIIVVFAIIVTVGFISKWIVLGRRAAQVRNGANFFTVVEAIYGGHWSHVSLPLVLCMSGTSFFFARSGHPWLIASFVPLFLGSFCNMAAKLLDRREYLYTGWYLILSGLVSLFFIESSPFVWFAVVWAGTFIVFGAAGLAAGRSGSGGRP